MAKGRADLAVETYRRVLRAKPNYAEAHNNLGVALAMRGQRQEAIEELSVAVRLAPDNREYASNLAAAKAGSVSPPSPGASASRGATGQMRCGFRCCVQHPVERPSILEGDCHGRAIDHFT